MFFTTTFEPGHRSDDNHVMHIFLVLIFMVNKKMKSSEKNHNILDKFMKKIIN